MTGLQIIAHLSLELNNKSPINSGRLLYGRRGASEEEGGETENGRVMKASSCCSRRYFIETRPSTTTSL